MKFDWRQQRNVPAKIPRVVSPEVALRDHDYVLEDDKIHGNKLPSNIQNASDVKEYFSVSGQTEIDKN